MKLIKNLYSEFIDLLSDFINLIYPKNCAVCNDYLVHQEKNICTRCLYDIPVTNFHNEKENTVHKLFWGRVNIENASAYFFFQKGRKYQKILHRLKYEGQKEIGHELGRIFGAELLKSKNYNNIDVLVPIPL